MVVAVEEAEGAVASLPKEVADPVVTEVLEVEALDMTELHNPDLLDHPVVYVPDIHIELVHPELQVVPEVLLVKLELQVLLYLQLPHPVELLVKL
tara:strand:+ start:275 stop:559 length:285 start_codon:yes stop_codon:yes gene_type:complete